jgi:hypothetical protein
MELSEDIQSRINQIQSALAGADNEVYEWAAKFVHTAAKINLFPLPCCQPIAHILPTKEAEKKTEPEPVKTPLWIPVLEMGQVKSYFVHPLSKHIAKGAHIKYAKEGDPNITVEGIAHGFYNNYLKVLNDKGYVASISYEHVMFVDAHSAGKPKSGYSVTYPDKYKVAQS